MKRVLVTGAAGLIGRHTLGPLQALGYEVHALTSKPTHQPNWHQVNLWDEAQVTHCLAQLQPTHLLHLAWTTEHGQFWQDPANFTWVRASVHLLQQFQAHGGQRVIMAGTCAEYDWNYGYCREELTPTNPQTTYGRCKNALRALLSAFAEQLGLSWGWGRIFFLYGPAEPPRRLVATVAAALLRGLPAPCSHGNQIRDFLHVQDVAAALVAFLTSEVQGCVNIGSGQPVSLKTLIYTLADLIGQRDLIQLDAIPAPSDPPLIVADVQRLSREVNWQPHYSLETGLTQTLTWWRNENHPGH